MIQREIAVDIKSLLVRSEMADRSSVGKMRSVKVFFFVESTVKPLSPLIDKGK